jgi:hypothetical protein
MGVGPLHEASYLAPYEESESFAACLTYLQTAGDQTPPAIRYLLAEFMKYLLHRGRFYYPQKLPAKAIAKKAKEGHIYRKLWVPLEDLRTGWQQSGQVGQEVYGSATAFVVTSRAYQRDPRCPQAPAHEKVVHFTKPELQEEPDGESEAIEGIKKEVRHAMELLNRAGRLQRSIS